MFGFWEVLLIVGLIVLIFGARKLPMLARGLGQGIRNFKGEIKEGSEGEGEHRLTDGDDHSRE